MIASTLAGRIERQRLERKDVETLLAAPWCWPAGVKPQAPALKSGPRLPLQTGCAPFVTESDGSVVALWVVGANDQSLLQVALPLSQETLVAVQCAYQAASRLVPTGLGALDWSSAHLARKVDEVALGDQCPRLDLVAGRSLGLAAALAHISRVLGQPHPVHVIAIGDIDATGVVRAVDENGFRAKLEGLRLLAPAITTVLCSNAQGAANAAPGARPQLVAVANLEEACAATWGRPLDAQITDAGTWKRLVREVRIRSFTPSGGGNFAGVARASNAIMRVHAEVLKMEPILLETLQYASAIAQRHINQAPSGDLPVPNALAKGPFAYEALAHWIQHQTDSGSADASEVERSARALVDQWDPIQHVPAHALPVVGALARFFAATGRATEALHLATATAGAFVECDKRSDATHSLSEAFRLAGLMTSAGGFQVAESLWREIQEAPAVAPGAPFVRLSRAKAGCLLGMPTHTWLPDVEALWANRQSAPAAYLGDSAGRLLALTRQERRAQIHETLTRELCDLDADRAWAAAMWLSLMALDKALAENADADATSAAEQVRALNPGLVGRLERTRPTNVPTPAWLARAYPY